MLWGDLLNCLIKVKSKSISWLLYATFAGNLVYYGATWAVITRCVLSGTWWCFMEKTAMPALIAEEAMVRSRWVSIQSQSRDFYNERLGTAYASL